jgi:hypothetical protein
MPGKNGGDAAEKPKEEENPDVGGFDFEEAGGDDVSTRGNDAG